MRSSYLFVILALLLPVSVWAAPYDGEGVPTVVFWHAVNLTILLTAFYFMLRRPVREFFDQRKSDFLAHEARSLKNREEAEKANKEISERLAKLEATANESLVRADSESAQMREKILAEAEETAKRILKEADAAVGNEFARARRELRYALIQDVIERARTQLPTSMGSEEQTRLQSEFVEKIQVVR